MTLNRKELGLINTEILESVAKSLSKVWRLCPWTMSSGSNDGRTSYVYDNFARQVLVIAWPVCRRHWHLCTRPRTMIYPLGRLLWCPIKRIGHVRNNVGDYIATCPRIINPHCLSRVHTLRGWRNGYQDGTWLITEPNNGTWGARDRAALSYWDAATTAPDAPLNCHCFQFG